MVWAILSMTISDDLVSLLMKADFNMTVVCAFLQHLKTAGRRSLINIVWEYLNVCQLKKCLPAISFFRLMQKNFACCAKKIARMDILQKHSASKR